MVYAIRCLWSHTKQQPDSASGDWKNFTGTEEGSPSVAEDSTRNRRVFVGNLAYRTTLDDLIQHLGSVGKIATSQILTNNLGRSVGGAIVEFDSEEAAKRAIETLNDSELDGRKIIIREDREDFSLHDPRRKMKQGDPRALQNRRIVVWNLPSHVRWQELKDLFKESGNILWTEVRNVRARDGGETVMGTVLFESEEDARRAVERMRGKNFLGRIIDCRFDSLR
ncbi:poly(A) binding protein isoform 2 [Galdieria sulphuraria]|uniref:Poly(A) binding protein isoform 2 n=1 Tax=Galdieria sulphuraria TaxID=130081 RepID=M2W5C9_GALSU|nr:poly(A) binding protein isoform 2 [Galdieria sulphuraria]EME30981.1 poly(A) binding protein isoform 2 [Galdieria sulphuraria]|eukprot:XP_005707501.1 poly(A) binding protein isoform 2 [Galdieria sulphuraria]